MPQSMVPPQPSPIVPQYWPPPGAVHVPFVQLAGWQTLARPPPPHTPPSAQAPHWSVPPHPSPIVPQKVSPPRPHVSLLQFGLTQTPPVHVVPVGHSPQSIPRPHPSPTLPQKPVH